MPGLMRAMVRTTAVVGTATAVSGRVAHRQQGKWAAQEQAAAPPAEAAPAEAAAPPPAASMDDKIAQLKELGELKTSGVLTEAEFEVQKDKILHP